MTNVNGISGEHLKNYIETIERFEAHKSELAEDIREVYATAKANGFDTKIMREIIKIRKKDKSELDEQEMLLHTYMLALGMIPEGGE